MWSLSFSTAWYLGRCLNSWDPVSCKSGINSEICEYSSCTPQKQELEYYLYLFSVWKVWFFHWFYWDFHIFSQVSLCLKYSLHMPNLRNDSGSPGFFELEPKSWTAGWTCVRLFSSRPWPRKTGKIVATNYFIIVMHKRIWKKMCILIAPCILHLVPCDIYFVFFLFTDISTYIWAISWQSDASKKHCIWNSNEVFDLDAGTWSAMIVMTFFLFEWKQLN